MKMYKKAFACVAAITIFALAVFNSGCTQKAKNPASVSESANENSGNSPLVSKEKITFRVMVPKGLTEVPYEQMSVFSKAEERTNVHIEFDNPTTEGYKEKIDLVIASGDIPDIIIAVPQGQILSYGQSGAIIPLNELIEKNAPNLKNLFAKYPAIRKLQTSSDGKIYSLSRFFSDDEKQRSARMNNPLQIREDWLRKLNLKEPVTTDDWYNVLKAFKEKDPNGNGIQDEIPFCNTGVGNIKDLVRAWGVEDGFYLPVGKKEIHYGPIEDRYREAITWIAKLYKEGLIDKEFATNNSKTFQTKVTSNLVGAYRGLLGAHMNTFNDTLPKSIPEFKVIGTSAMKGPYGDQREPISGLTSTPYAVITQACKKPEAAVKWLDYFYGEEGSVMLTFGPDEKTYNKGSDGHYRYSDYVMKNPDGKANKEVIGSFSPVQSGWPALFVYDSHLALNPPGNIEVLEKLAKTPAESIPNLSFSIADDEMRSQIMTDVQAYVSAQILKFITDKEPISGWDAYVAQVKGMGIEKVIKMYNDSYGEWQKK